MLQSDGDKTEWKALITLAESLPVDVRFIELMPIGYGKENTGVSNLELLDEIRKVYPDIRKDSKIHGNGPAAIIRFQDSPAVSDLSVRCTVSSVRTATASG